MQHFDASLAAADESFQLPMLGLYADLETGAASVSLPDHFQTLAPAVRCQVLSSWLRDLRRAHDELLRQHPDVARACRQAAELAAGDDPA